MIHSTTTLGCRTCGEQKPATNEFFPVAKRNALGLAHECKDCLCLRGKRHYQAKKDTGLIIKKFHPLRADCDSPIKICSKCGEGFPRSSEFFNKNATSRDGLMAKCRACQAILKRDWYLRHQEQEVQNTRDYRAERPEGALLRRLKRLQDPQAARDRDNLYNATNPERLAAANHNHRAGKLGIPGRTDATELKALRLRQDNCCPYCEREMVGKVRATLDHTIPVSRPELGATNSIENLLWTCWTCNRDKWDQTLEEWAIRWYEVEELNLVIRDLQAEQAAD